VNLFSSAKLLGPFEKIPVEGMPITFEVSSIVCLVNVVSKTRHYSGLWYPITGYYPLAVSSLELLQRISAIEACAERQNRGEEEDWIL
jgi:hypothetical protein